MSMEGSRLTRGLARARQHAPKIALELLANFVLPFLIYDFGRGRLGDVGALLAASAPPIAWSVAGFVRERRFDAISLMVLGGIALSLLAFLGGGGVKFLQLRENLVAGVVGLIFLGSAAIGRPLIYHLARAGVRRRIGDRVAAFEALRDNARFRRQLTLATLVWGVGLLTVCGVSCALVFMVSIKTYLLVSPPVGYGLTILLTAWTFWYVPRAIRQVGLGGPPPA
ncbi:MAG TPA: VC0807 family protein [Caulobacteraceae bacterium]|jgi:hypothetical protein|nr:VC0807 family protein [Caulobacteraceae bacterium]